MRIWRPALFIVVLTVSSFVAANVLADDVPVVDINSQSNGNEQSNVQVSSAASQPVLQPLTAVQQSLPLDQRVLQLEQQMNNLVQMNLPSQITALQQQVQQLSGQLEVQSHDLEMLQEQQRNFYQDLNQRLNNLKTLSGNGDASTIDSAAANTNTTTAASTDKNAKGTIFSDEETAYQKAFSLLTNKQYDQAATALQNFLNEYPNGKYAVNAHYWLGELYFNQGKKQQASTEFQSVVTNFPHSDKAPDARLKLAMLRIQNGQVTQGKQELTQIIKAYPDSSAAKLAKLQLNQIQQP